MPLCKEFGIQAVSCHYDTPLVTGNFDAWKSDFPQGRPAGFTWEKAVDDAAAAGVKYMVVAYLQPAERGSLDTFRRYADQFNKAGEATRKAGMQFCYHHHAFEFGPKEGSRPIDVFLDRFDPKLVKFQFQVSTISEGYDAPEYFTKYPGRFISMHVQGWSAKTRKIVPVGQGTLDWKKIFTAAKTGGIKNYFVEMDLEMMKASVPYLRQLQV